MWLRTQVVGQVDSVVKMVLTLCQIVAFLHRCALLRSVYQQVKQGVLCFLQHVGILQHMRGVQRNCRLRTIAYKTTDTVLDVLKEQPGGYTFYGLLPRKGERNVSVLRRKITDVMLSSLFTESFLAILVQAAITPNGRPREKLALYQWLLTYVYAGNVQLLYKDWLAVKDKECEV